MFKSIFKAYSTSLLGVLSGLLTQLVFIRELVHMVPANEFALYAFCYQICIYLNILQLGLDFATSREIALKLAKADHAGAIQSYLFIRRFNNKICLGGFVIVIVGALLFYNGFALGPNFNPLMAAKLVMLFGTWLAIKFLANPNIVALIGNNSQAVVNVNYVLTTICTTLTSLVLLKTSSLGVYSMPLSLIAFSVVNFFLLKNKAFKYCKAWLINDISIIIPEEYNKRILQFSVITTIGGLAWTIEATSDVFILNGSGLLSLVGFYVLWWRFPQMFFELAERLTTSAIPSLNTLYSRSEADAGILFNRLLLFVGGIAFIAFIGIACCLTSFIYLWVGSGFFIDDLQWVSFLIGLLVYSRVIGNCFGMFTITIGRVKYSTTLSWVQAIVKVTLAIILAGSMGLKGLFIASIAGSLIQVTGCIFLLLKIKILRKDVLLLIAIGYLAPVILLFSRISVEVTLFQFLYIALITSVCAALSWLFYIKITALDTRLKFSLSVRQFFSKWKLPD